MKTYTVVAFVLIYLGLTVGTWFTFLSGIVTRLR